MFKIYFENNLERYSDEKYYPWEKIKFLEIPEELESPEELWYVIRWLRYGRPIPVKNIDGSSFRLKKVNFLEELLHHLDLSLGGSFLDISLTKNEQKIFLQNGIAEEAISSSQIEWALTSSKVARDMISKWRKAITKDEKMILNNYRAMNYIKDELIKELLTKESLIYLQSILTKETLDNPDEVWRLRRDMDEIVVQDKLTGEVYHIPPKEEVLLKEIDSFIRYANDEDESGFTHPFIKAVILHFWIGFLHPFCDGNGRTARAIFYWYLLKKWYWGFSYIPISQAIKNSKKQYTDAYLYSEQDGNDLTYFLVYIANKTNQAFEEFKNYVNKKKKEQKGIMSELSHLWFNDRQVKLIGYFLENPKSYTNNSIHKNYYNISINTAKTDLETLNEKWLLNKTKQWRYVNYFPVDNLSDIL
jgi:Fic family protein